MDDLSQLTPAERQDLEKAAEAQQTLFQQVWVPSFVEKAASYGIQFPDDASLGRALEVVGMLESHSNAGHVDIQKEAHAALQQKLGIVDQAAAHEKQGEAMGLLQQPAIQQALAQLTPAAV